VNPPSVLALADRADLVAFRDPDVLLLLSALLHRTGLLLSDSGMRLWDPRQLRDPFDRASDLNGV
jgi:hypothetical protein